MSRKVYKYVIGLCQTEVELPVGAICLYGGYDSREYVCLWFEVDEELGVETREFAVIVTGQPIPFGWGWVTTVINHPFVWHVYENFDR